MAFDVAPYDSSDYLTTASLVRGYIALVLEEEGVEQLPAALSTIARSAGLSAFAAEIGLDPDSLRRAFLDPHAFDAPLMLEVLNAIGWRLTPSPVAAAA